MRISVYGDKTIEYINRKRKKDKIDYKHISLNYFEWLDDIYEELYNEGKVGIKERAYTPYIIHNYVLNGLDRDERFIKEMVYYEIYGWCRYFILESKYLETFT